MTSLDQNSIFDVEKHGNAVNNHKNDVTNCEQHANAHRDAGADRHPARGIRFVLSKRSAAGLTVLARLIGKHNAQQRQHCIGGNKAAGQNADDEQHNIGGAMILQESGGGELLLTALRAERVAVGKRRATVFTKHECLLLFFDIAAILGKRDAKRQWLSGGRAPDSSSSEYIFYNRNAEFYPGYQWPFRGRTVGIRRRPRIFCGGDTDANAPDAKTPD